MAVQDCAGRGGHRSVDFLELLEAFAKEEVVLGSSGE